MDLVSTMFIVFVNPRVGRSAAPTDIHGWVAYCTVYTYFNNDKDGHTVTNAKPLRGMID